VTFAAGVLAGYLLLYLPIFLGSYFVYHYLVEMIRFHEAAAAVIFGPFGDVAQRGGAFMWFFVFCVGVITVSDYQGPGLFWALGIGVLGIWLIIADYRKFIR
jgi:hypothetical protein